MEWEYDPSLDRLDVALRSVWHDANKGGRLLTLAGIHPEVIAQVQQLSAKSVRPATERQVFAALRACPDLLAASALMLLHYYQSCGNGRTAFYERLSSL